MNYALQRAFIFNVDKILRFCHLPPTSDVVRTSCISARTSHMVAPYLPFGCWALRPFVGGLRLGRSGPCPAFAVECSSQQWATGGGFHFSEKEESLIIMQRISWQCRLTTGPSQSGLWMNFWVKNCTNFRNCSSEESSASPSAPPSSLSSAWLYYWTPSEGAQKRTKESCNPEGTYSPL